MGKWIIGLALVVLGAAGIAVAGQDRGAANVTLCAQRAGGELSLGARGKCSKGEKKVTIAKRGPAGPQGEQGPAGADGDPADLAPESPRTVANPSRQDCASFPATYCGNPQCTGSWAGNVSFQKDAAGFVHLRGAAFSSTGGICTTDAAGPFFLPAGYRPTDIDRVFLVPKCEGDGGDVYRVRVETSGLIRVLSGNAACMALDPVSFHP